MPIPAPEAKSRFNTPAKVIAASVVSVLLGIGLCNVGHFNFEGESSVLAEAGVLAFFGGIIGGFIGASWLAIAAIASGGRD